MHPLCRFESTRDHLRWREQSPCPAMRALRGRHRPRNRLQPPTPPLSKTKPRPNTHLRKRSMEEESPHDGLAFTGVDWLILFVLFIWLIWFIWLASRTKRPERPDKPNERVRLEDSHASGGLNRRHECALSRFPILVPVTTTARHSAPRQARALAVGSAVPQTRCNRRYA